jgi:hypothetical protein
MSSSYQALLSLSPADWIGGSEFADDNLNDDGEEAAAAADGAVSSYLSFDVGEEEYYFHHTPEPAAFHAEEPQQAPETLLLDTLQSQTDYYCVAGSSSEGELIAGKQNHTDASALSSEGLTASHER